MWKSLLVACLLLSLCLLVTFAANTPTVLEETRESSDQAPILDADTPVFENSFVALDFEATFSLASIEFLSIFLIDSGFLELPQTLQFTCLEYLNGQSLFNFSRSRRIYQLLTKMYACNSLKITSISIPATDVLKILTFVNECLPKLKQAFPAFLQNRALSWIDAAWVLTLTSLKKPITDIYEFCCQPPISTFLGDTPATEGFSPYWIVSMFRKRKSFEEILLFLLTSNCRQPILYEYLLDQVSDLNALQLPDNPHILFKLIELGMYFPSLMERPELMTYVEPDFPAGDAFVVEFYDIAWDLSIYSRNFPAFLSIIQMPYERFSYLSSGSLNTLRKIFLAHSRTDQLLEEFDFSNYGSESNINQLPDSDSEESIEFYSIEYDLMTVIASFLHIPGKHQESFIKLYRTGAYDMQKSVIILFQGGLLDVIRELFSHLPVEELYKLRCFNDFEVLEAMNQENALEIIEIFTLLPRFTPFECFSFLNHFHLTPSSTIAQWIDEKDPLGILIYRQYDDRILLDPFGRPVDLLRYSIMLGNLSLVAFCLNR